MRQPQPRTPEPELESETCTHSSRCLQLERAAKCFKQALAVNPLVASCWFTLGCVRLQQRSFGAAVAASRARRRSSPTISRPGPTSPRRSCRPNRSAPRRAGELPHRYSILLLFLILILSSCKYYKFIVSRASLLLHWSSLQVSNEPHVWQSYAALLAHELRATDAVMRVAKLQRSR